MPVTKVENLLNRPWHITPEGDQRKTEHEITVTFPFPRDSETEIELDSFVLSNAELGLPWIEDAEVKALDGTDLINAQWDGSAGGIRVTKVSEPEEGGPKGARFKVIAFGPPEFVQKGRE